MVFGDNVKNLTKDMARRYYNNNEMALEAFEQRKVDGLSLSDRVWKYTDQFKDEIEMGLSVGLKSGKSAEDLQRELQDFLRHPDMLFRRVRDEFGQLQLSKRAAAYHPGRGVYRSSYKNARRLAATEINIAYRTADYTRWQQLDFVVGIEIKTSNNHPEPDICDDLKGKYPKDFKFTGWHPHCRCHAESILKTEDEMAEDTRRILLGKDPAEGSVNEVTADNSDGFAKLDKWVEKNAGRIEAAKKRGMLPYFIKDNERFVEEKRIVATKPGNTRRERRTEQQEKTIRDAWHNHRMEYYSGEISRLSLGKYEHANNPYTALSARKEAIYSAIRKDADVSAVQMLFTRYKDGVATQKKWDGLVWDGISGPQYKNCREIEKRLGILKGRPMIPELADNLRSNPYRVYQWIETEDGNRYMTINDKRFRVSLNPLYNKKKHEKYEINCATCAPTYVLRARGFNIKAKGRVDGSDSLNDKIAYGKSFDPWKSSDGKSASAIYVQEYMESHKWKRMSPDRYKQFYEEACKDEGIYITTVNWKGGGGHATIIQKLADGRLVHIEPQEYYKSAGTYRNMETEIYKKLSQTPYSNKGVMRVDDKLFDVSWADLFLI